MERAAGTQLNIRSRFARERATMLARETGMTTTQVVEEALRAYLPLKRENENPRLVRKGAILVRPAEGRRVNLEDANAELDKIRAERGG